jgi:hypothetical protein
MCYGGKDEENVHVEGHAQSARHDHRAHCRARHRPRAERQSRIAKKLKEEYGPTVVCQLLLMCQSQWTPNVPRSSASHRDQFACCASHDTRRQHRGETRTRRMRSCAVSLGSLGGPENTYSLLEAERGAGISQRTRRPYLGWTLEMGGYAGRMRKGRGREGEASVALTEGGGPSLRDRPLGGASGEEGMRDRGRRCRRRSGRGSALVRGHTVRIRRPGRERGCRGRSQ